MNNVCEEEQKILDIMNKTIEKNTSFSLDIAKIQIESIIMEESKKNESKSDEEKNNDGK